MKCGTTLGNGLGNTWELGITSGNLVRTHLGTFVGTLQNTPLPLSPRKKRCPPPPPPWANHLIGWVKFLFLKPFCHHVLPGLIPLPKEVGYLLSITDLSRGQFCHFFTKYFGSTLFSTISSFAAFINPSIWHMSYEIGHLAESTSQKLLKCWNGLPTCAYMAGKWTSGALDS